MRVLLCDRGNVLAEFQHRLRDVAPDLEIEVETDAARAVERAYRFRPDVIVTEIDLKGATGIELVRRFKAAVPGTPVVCWTRVTSADTALAMLGGGASGYLLKDDPVAHVAGAIRAAATGVLSISRSVAEITARRESQGRLRELELEDALAQAAGQFEQMTTAKGEFLANISHELRTPVTVAKGISHVLANRDVPEDARVEFLGKLTDSLDKLMSIVDGILTIAESDRGQLELDVEEIDLAPIVHEVAAEVAARYPEVRVDQAIPRVLVVAVDPKRIVDVLRHVLDNACRYSPEGGEVWLRGRAMTEGVVISVTDRGEGIDRAVVSRAFAEPFSTGEATLRKERAGAGLGLHMARKLVVEHGGVMWADPLPAGGTRVSFCLPERTGQTVTKPADSVIEQLAAPPDDARAPAPPPMPGGSLENRAIG